jgi:gamma-glutamylcyclotransferase (GGCT)/AIG2-like uncharacterized protein YtfP
MNLQNFNDENIDVVFIKHPRIVNFLKQYTEDEINERLLSFIDFLEKFGGGNSSLKEIKKESGEKESFLAKDYITINKYVLQEINKEYHDVLKNKDKLIGLVKETNKQSMDLMDTMKMPYLEKYMVDSGLELNLQISNQFKCELCNYYVCNTKKALSSHQRGCKKIVGSF